MYQDNIVLCGSSAYDRKYYLNEDFKGLPQQVQDELKIACVLFTEDVGGLFLIEFDEEYGLVLKTDADEGDLLYDEIGAALKVKKLQEEKKDLFEAIEMYYRVFFLGEDLEES